MRAGYEAPTDFCVGFGPFTWPVDAARIFGANAGVINLPPTNAHKGVLAWAALGHEDAGHDILHAYAGLQDQLATALHAAAGVGQPDLPHGKWTAS